MNTIPQSQWPKPYLLKVMEQAVKEGCIRLDFKHDAELAKSFQGAINRIRRRSDKQHASFITPEFHLITTTWEAARGTMLVTYSSMPDDMQLPEIQSVAEDEKHEIAQPQRVDQPEAMFPGRPSTTTSGEIDPDALIDELLRTQKS